MSVPREELMRGLPEPHRTECFSDGAVGVFVFVVGYYALTSQGIALGREGRSYDFPA